MAVPVSYELLKILLEQLRGQDSMSELDLIRLIKNASREPPNPWSDEQIKWSIANLGKAGFLHKPKLTQSVGITPDGSMFLEEVLLKIDEKSFESLQRLFDHGAKTKKRYFMAARAEAANRFMQEELDPTNEDQPLGDLEAKLRKREVIHKLQELAHQDYSRADLDRSLHAVYACILIGIALSIFFLVLVVRDNRNSDQQSNNSKKPETTIHIDASR